MATEKISILLPVKNEEQFLRQALDSILEQTESEFEVIAVNDHSSDRSADILAEYTARDSRIHVYLNRGAGVIDALKTALEFSTGSLITRQDADDLMPAEKLADLKHLLLAHGPGHIATGHVKYFCAGSIGDGYLKYERWLNSLCAGNSHRHHLFKECVFASANWLLYKTDLRRIEAISKAVYPEDYFLAFKVFEHGLRVVSTNKITHLWRDHPSRASRTLEQYRDQKYFKLKVEFFIKFYGSDQIALWGAGPSGKKLAKELIAAGVEFCWVTNNQNKIGKVIYGVLINNYQSLQKLPPQKIIVSVTQRNSSATIAAYIKELAPVCWYNF